MGYFEANRELLRELFVTLGKERDWTDDVDALVSHMSFARRLSLSAQMAPARGGAASPIVRQALA